MAGALRTKALAWLRGQTASGAPEAPPAPPRPVERVVKRKQGRKRSLSDTQILPSVPPPDFDAPRTEREKTRRLPRQTEDLGLCRTPLILEFVGTAAIATAPSPHVRPDLIGKTIAGGKRVKGATTTANVGLRSSPSGFANYGNVRKEKKKKKKKKK